MTDPMLAEACVRSFLKTMADRQIPATEQMVILVEALSRSIDPMMDEEGMGNEGATAGVCALLMHLRGIHVHGIHDGETLQ